MTMGYVSERAIFPTGSKPKPFGIEGIDAMATKVMKTAVAQAGYVAHIHDDSPGVRILEIVEKPLHNCKRRVLVTFAFRSVNGGVIAVRLRRLAEQGVHPAQWAEHMPEVVRMEQFIAWKASTTRYPSTT